MNLGRDSEARFGQDFEAQVLWRGWCLVEILKMMLGRDSEDEIWSRFVFELVIWTQPSGPLCLWQCFKSWPRLSILEDTNWRISSISNSLGIIYLWLPEPFLSLQTLGVFVGRQKRRFAYMAKPSQLQNIASVTLRQMLNHRKATHLGWAPPTHP